MTVIRGGSILTSIPMGRIRRMLLTSLTLLLAACRSPANDPFAGFRSAVDKSFAPVAAQFGLGERSEKAFPAELYLEFRGERGSITVSQELGSSPWCAVSVVAKSGLPREFGLHTIVEEQTGSREVFDRATTVQGVDAEVRALAALTRRHAGSLLTQRTANLRKLQELQTKRLHESEREAGLPPAKGELTLPMIFRGSLPERRAAYVYFAVVDQNHSVDEVAAFLRIPKSEVEQMIRDHDTIQ